MMPATSPNFDRVQRLALVVGGVALVLALVGLVLGPLERFFEAYLMAFVLYIGLSLGCLIMLMVVQLAGGSWGATIRRPLEAGAMVIPVMALLFIPLIFGLGHLYPWTDEAYLASHPTVAIKTNWLNEPFFVIRSVIYLLIWTAIAFYYYRVSKRQDDGDRPDLTDRLKRISGAMIIVYVLTATLAAFDWGMSLRPDWFSGIYGALFMIGQAISAVAFIIIFMILTARLYAPYDKLLTAKRLQDLGNFLMGFIMFWAYVNVSQLIIQWSNNIVETNTWYVARLGEGWVALSAFMLIFHFFAPWMILFSRWVKRKREALIWVAAWMLLMRFFDVFWIFAPEYGRGLHWLDPVLFIAFGGVWLAAFFARFKRLPPLPLHDPRLKLEDDHAHATHPAHPKTQGAVSHG
jgi:hypothetical protein